MKRVAVLLAALSLACCLRAPSDPVTYEAYAEVHLSRAFPVGEYTIAIDDARLAFGPAYFCAASQGAPTQCDSSVAEIRKTTALDATISARQPLGSVRGFTGSVRSVSYDMGLDWFETQTSVTARPEAPGGHSLVVHGTARRGAIEIPFVVRVDVTPQYQGQRAVSTAPAIADVDNPRTALVVSFDVETWLRQVDFAALEAGPDRPAAVDPGTRENTAVLVGLKALKPPEFRWERTH